MDFSFHLYPFLYLFPFLLQIAYYFCNQKEIIVLFFKLICVPQLPAPLWNWNNLFSKRWARKDPSGMGEVRDTHVTTLRVRVRLWKNTSDATPSARFWSRLLFLLFFLTCVFYFIFKIFTFWPRYAAYRILVPWPGIRPTPPALEAWSLNHWTAWEGPSYSWITPPLALPPTRPCEIIPVYNLLL